MTTWGDLIRDAVAGVARAALAPYGEQLAAAIREARADRGAWVVRRFRAEQPALAALADSFFTGTPDEALAALAALWPEANNIPNAAGVVGEIQRQLKEQR